MSDFIKRMIVERDELRERFTKLIKFLELEEQKAGTDTLDDYESHLMYKQAKLMMKYITVLNSRIGQYAGKEED